MSDVAVVRRVDPIQGPPSAIDPLQARGGKVTPELLDVVSSEVGDQVEFYAVAYPPAPIDAPVEVSIEIWRDGQLILRTPASTVPPDSTGAASILAGIPLQKLSAGQYEAQISFQYKGQRVTKVAAFGVPVGGITGVSAQTNAPIGAVCTPLPQFSRKEDSLMAGRMMAAIEDLSGGYYKEAQGRYADIVRDVDSKDYHICLRWMAYDGYGEALAALKNRGKAVSVLAKAVELSKNLGDKEREESAEHLQAAQELK
jgi:hypothetical protein